MYQESSQKSASKPASEAAVRRVFGKHFKILTKVLLEKQCHRNIEGFIDTLIGMLQFLKREAARKKRSREYLELCQDLGAATTPIGGMSRMSEQELKTLDGLMKSIVRGFQGKPAFGRIEPKSFISLNRRIFIQPKSSGPKGREIYDEAFRRYQKRESVSAIARDLDPLRYQYDAAGSIDRFSKAIHRRSRSHTKRPIRRNSRRKYV